MGEREEGRGEPSVYMSTIKNDILNLVTIGGGGMWHVATTNRCGIIHRGGMLTGGGNVPPPKEVGCPPPAELMH